MDKKGFFYRLSIKSIIIGLICGTAAISVILLLFALIMSFGIIPVSLSSLLSSFALSMGALFAGFMTAKIEKKNGLLYGFLTGAILFLIFTVISLLGVKSTPTLTTLLKGIITIIAGGVGGILGVNTGNKRKI